MATRLTPLLIMLPCALLASGWSARASDEEAASAENATATMPAGPMLEPLTKPEVAGVASVPEPVFASILAASAVILLRRGRR